MNTRREHIECERVSQGEQKSTEKTFHTPSFGDDDFDVSSMQIMQQTHQTHQMDQYPMPMPPQQMQDQQYMWQQQDANQRNFAAPPNNMNMPIYNSPMMDPQMHYGDPVYNHQGQPQNHMQQIQPRPVQAQGPLPPPQQQQQIHYQQTQQSQDQMLMMPPPYKSPPMNVQQPQIMSSPTTHQINQSPHYGVPTENGTTSEDSDGSVNTLKRPSPEPLNESPSKGGKAAASAPKKPKPPRKKKKKDPNEPTKPVSAYALFFRDTQAAIKGQNPTASFGDVSTIVASMWDGLEHEHKEVYKKKTEAAKKEYLKTLAVYRASIVSKGNDIDSTKPSTPTGTMSPQNQLQQANSTQQSPQSLPNQQNSTQPSVQVKQESPNSIQAQLQNQPNVNMNPQQQQQQSFIAQQQAGPQTSMPQSSPYQQTYNPPTNAYKSSPNPNQIDYNSMNMSMPHNQLSPIHHQSNVPQNHQMQMQQHMGHPQQQVPMVRYGYEQQAPPPPQQHNIAMNPYNSSPNHGNLQPPMQQIPTHHQPYGSEGGYNIHANDVSNQNFNSFQLNQQPTTTMVLHNMPPNQLQETQTATATPQLCIRSGCINQAVVHNDWEDEYCGSECVVLHCRNVFSNWVQSNNNAASINPQQNFSVK
ncbi:TOX high mobility group box family member 3 isoform X3 [Contarinia nasturtii]|uniref:TOX high mobility group box family member 3 isoform X3 n=1 Tax=Contarinia nasturtii TaxID=265458 RepID=UPI0012D4AEF1|nr:TOX high mobility group box family member 3 isoform X3 [Contarinia nasturtii]